MPDTTLITTTRVVTARMTPSSVRKLRSLCARRESRASRIVSRNVTSDARQPLKSSLAVLAGTAVDNPPIGMTPKPTLPGHTRMQLYYARTGPFVPLDADISKAQPEKEEFRTELIKQTADGAHGSR